MTATADGSATLAQLLAEYAEVETALSDPAVHADQAAARRLGRRFAQLAPVVSAVQGAGRGPGRRAGRSRTGRRGRLVRS